MQLGEGLIPTDPKVISFLSKLTGLSSVQTNKIQLNLLFDALLSEFTSIFLADFSYIKLITPKRSFKDNIFQRSNGIPIEYCNNLNGITMKNKHKTILDTNFQYLFVVEDIDDERVLESTKMLGIKSIISIPILGTDRELSAIYLYFKNRISISPLIISSIHAFAELLAINYINSFTLIYTHQNVLDRNEYFNNAFEYTFVIDDLYDLKDANYKGINFLGDSRIISELNFTSLLNNQTDIDTFYSITKQLEIGQNTNEEIFIIRSPTDSDIEIIMAFGITKYKSEYGTIKYILSGREIIEEISYQETASNIENKDNYQIIPLLTEFKKINTVNQELAIEKFMNVFFPASYVFTVNEETGPMMIAASPNINQLKVLQEIIKLMAGLNTEQLSSQTYTNGITPWSNPEGNLHWIAFTVSNENARGKIETHVLGVVVKRNLITAKPNLLQGILGSLMGGMNDYVSILHEDNADFVTTAFNNDRNFSTLTLINESLNYLRHISIELLGAFTYGAGEY